MVVSLKTEKKLHLDQAFVQWKQNVHNVATSVIWWNLYVISVFTSFSMYCQVNCVRKESATTFLPQHTNHVVFAAELNLENKRFRWTDEQFTERFFVSVVESTGTQGTTAGTFTAALHLVRRNCFVGWRICDTQGLSAGCSGLPESHHRHRVTHGRRRRCHCTDQLNADPDRTPLDVWWPHR